MGKERWVEERGLCGVRIREWVEGRELCGRGGDWGVGRYIRSGSGGVRMG